jgi:putative Mn2+ efflux pump MntP
VEGYICQSKNNCKNTNHYQGYIELVLTALAFTADTFPTTVRLTIYTVFASLIHAKIGVASSSYVSVAAGNNLS